MRKNMFWIQSCFILGLSIVLNYKPPDFNEVNWDIVLFLTPYGIIHNFINKNNTVLWSFYSDISTGQLQITENQNYLSILIYFLMVISVVLYFKNEREIK